MYIKQDTDQKHIETVLLCQYVKELFDKQIIKIRLLERARGKHFDQECQIK